MLHFYSYCRKLEILSIHRPYICFPFLRQQKLYTFRFFWNIFKSRSAYSPTYIETVFPICLRTSSVTETEIIKYNLCVYQVIDIFRFKILSIFVMSYRKKNLICRFLTINSSAFYIC